MNQHFVPRVYLRSFSSKKGKEYFIDVYDKKEDRNFNTNIKNICAEKDLYTLDEDNTVAKDILAIEKIYAQGLEPIYKYAYDLLTNDRVRKINNYQRAQILLGVFQMYMRNPRLLRYSNIVHRKRIKALCNNARDNGIKGITYLDEDFSFSEWEDEQIIKYFTDKATKLYKEKHIIGTKEIGEFHQFARFEVFRIVDDSEFLTSDNPLIFQDIVTKDENPLLKSKEFTLPLNPKCAVKVFHDNTKELNEIKRCIFPNGSVGILNDTLYNQSSRFLLGSKEGLNKYFKIIKFLSGTELEKKIDIMRQVVTKIPVTEETKEGHKILEYYLEKYDQDRTLSNLDQHKMMQRINKIAASIKGQKIK